MDFVNEFPFSEVLDDEIYKYVKDDKEDLYKTQSEVVKESQSPNIGLTTKQAKQRIRNILEEILEVFEREKKSKPVFLDLLERDLALNIISFILLLGSAVISVIAYTRDEFIGNRWEYLVEPLLMALWLGLNVYFKVLIRTNSQNIKSNKIIEIINFMNTSWDSKILELDYKSYNIDPPSSDLLPVYRDMEWVRLPKNVIVKGDVFKLKVNQVFPCDCKLVSNIKGEELTINDQIYKEGSKCTYVGTNTENEKYIDGTFTAVTDSCRSYLNAFIKSGVYGKKPSTSFDKEVQTVEKRKSDERRSITEEVVWNFNDNYIFLNSKNKVFVLLIVVITVTLNISWNFMYNIEHKILILLYFARLLILFDFVGFDPFYKWLELWGNVKLLSIFEIYQVQRSLKDLDPMRSMSSSSFMTDSSYSSVSSDPLMDEITLSFQYKQLSKVLKKGMFQERSMIQQLSTITLLCFIDDIGLLMNSNQTLQEISVITPNPRKEDINENKTELETTQENENKNDNTNINNTTNNTNINNTNNNNNNNKNNTNNNKNTNNNNNTNNSNKNINTNNDNTDNINSTYNVNTSSIDMDVNKEDEKEEGQEAEGDDDELMILDVFNDSSLYGKDNIRFTTEYEKKCKNLLKPLIFSMSLTSIPSHLPSYNYSLENIGKGNLGFQEATFNKEYNQEDRGPRAISEPISRHTSDTNALIKEDIPRELELLQENGNEEEKKRLTTQLLISETTLGKNRLYNNYISMLINNELDSFTNCLCTLTNVLGIKKQYIKRYKLLKFVLLNYTSNGTGQSGEGNTAVKTRERSKTEYIKITEELEDKKMQQEDENKILVYFYRDVNKKIIQMLIKCKISVINNYKLNYFNGTKINQLNKRIKRKLRDLDIQWLSNGMNTFLYFYKPISVNDFNILVLLLPYITVYNISSKNGGREGNSSRSSGPNMKQLRSRIIRRNEKSKIYMYMYKSNTLYYKYKGINILELSKRTKSQPTMSDSFEKTPTNELKKYGITQNSQHTNRYPVDKDVILGSYIGEMLNSYIKNSILLGMVGTKYSLPREISNRIKDLHEAGIRFVYFSKHNEKMTRIIGGLLGLETSWNSMISLSTSETSSFINQEGHTVLPNGIDNIRQHIKYVDDIPLQVSLFCNCNSKNIVEMLDILNENGDNIMCVGSGLNPNNFHLFNNSHVAFSISLGYSPICKFCKGKRWQGISKLHIFEDPKPEFKLSSLLTSLTCSFHTSQLYKVSDPDFIFEMLFDLFKEARNISTNLQEATSFMLLSYYSLIWMYFFQQLFSLPPILTTLDFSLIVYVYIPYLSLTLSSNPEMDKIMEHLPNKIGEKSKMTVKNFVRTYIRLIFMSLCFILVFYVNTYYSNLNINDKYGLDDKYCSNFFYYPKMRCVNRVVNFLRDEKLGVNPQISILLAQNFTSISLVVFMAVNSISWIQKYSYINLQTFTNIRWVAAVVIILAAQISIVAMKMIFLNMDDFQIIKRMIITTSFSLLMTVPILFFNQIIKIFVIKDKNVQQKFLQLLFSTRLGTWSPK